MSQVRKYLNEMNKIYGRYSNMYKSSNSFVYNGVFDFLIREGRVFKSEKLNQTEKQATEKLIEAFISCNGHPMYKKCFYNAQMALFHDKENIFRYSEGYAMSSVGLPLLHAFLTINDKVVDFTWKHSNGDYCVGDKAGEYFGVKFNTVDVRNVIHHTKTAQSHLDCYWNKGLLFRQKFNDSIPYYRPEFVEKNPPKIAFSKKNIQN